MAKRKHATHGNLKPLASSILVLLNNIIKWPKKKSEIGNIEQGLVNCTDAQGRGMVAGKIGDSDDIPVANLILCAKSKCIAREKRTGRVKIHHIELL
jgi:hypothetical protein